MKAFQADAWTALFALKGVPTDIMSKIHDAYAKAMADEALINKLKKLGGVAPESTQQSPTYREDLVASDVDRWAKVIFDANISIAD